MDNDRKNIRYLPWFSAFRAFDALLPFYVLYTKQYGLSYFEIFITQIIFSIGLLIFDVPLGIYSDLYGRRKSLMLGGIAACISYGLFAFWPVFWGFALGEMALALSVAACSGADTSLLFESMKRLQQLEHYCEQEGKYQSFARYSEAISSILGGFFALFSLKLPAVFTWLTSIARLHISLLLHDKEGGPKEQFSAIFIKKVKEQMTTIKACFLRKNHTVVLILLYSGLLSAMIINIFWLLQVFFKTYHMNYFMIGILCAIYHGTSGLCSSQASRLLIHFKRIKWILPLLFQGMLIVLSMVYTIWFFPVFLLSAIVFGIKMPFIYNLLHAQVDDTIRAGVLSFDSFFTRMLFSILALPMGWILDHLSLQTAFLFLTIPNGVVLWIAYRLKI